jgi:hypothetical protein
MLSGRQLVPDNLARRIARNLLHDPDIPGLLEARHFVCQKLPDRLFVDVGARLWHDERHRSLAVVLVADNHPT